MRKVLRWIILAITILASAYVIISSVGALAIDGSKALRFLWGPWIASALLIVGFILLTIWATKFSKGTTVKAYLISACTLIVAGIIVFPMAVNYNKSLPSMYAPTVKSGEVEITAENFKKGFNENNQEHPIQQIISTQANTNNDILYTTMLDCGTQIQFECDPKTYYLKSMIISNDNIEGPSEFGYAVGRSVSTIDHTFSKYDDRFQKLTSQLKISDTSDDHTSDYLYDNIHYVYSVKSGTLNFLIQPQNY